MSSFTRTIPGSKRESLVEKILSRSDHFIPIRIHPNRARSGDFIYLVFRNRIVGRARIKSIYPVNAEVPAHKELYPDWANWAIQYQGSWEEPPREIPFQGHQGIQYLETNSLAHLDSEEWKARQTLTTADAEDGAADLKR